MFWFCHLHLILRSPRMRMRSAPFFGVPVLSSLSSEVTSEVCDLPQVPAELQPTLSLVHLQKQHLLMQGMHDQSLGTEPVTCSVT